MHHEVIVCIYSALGHNNNNPRETTFSYIRNNPKILLEAFGLSSDEVTDVLAALDPRPGQSWINLGNCEAHRFSFSEAFHLTSDPTIKRLLSALAGPENHMELSIQDAAYSKHVDLAGRMEEIKRIENLPHPHINNPSIAAQMVRGLEEHRQHTPPCPRQALATLLVHMVT